MLAHGALVAVFLLAAPTTSTAIEARANLVPQADPASVQSLPPEGSSDSDCSTAQLAGASASATLNLDGSQSDDASWASAIEFSLPATWPLARDLLKDDGSDGFLIALDCIGGIPSDSGKPAARLDGQRVLLTFSSSGEIGAADQIYPNSPWSLLDYRQNHIRLAFRPLEQDLPAWIPWKSVRVTAEGFSLKGPEPLATVKASAGDLQWDLSHNSNSGPTFTAEVPRYLNFALYMESGGFGQYIPVDLEALVLLSLLFLLLRRGSGFGSTIEPARKVLRLAAGVLAMFAAYEVALDVSSQTTGSLLGPADYWLTGLALLLLSASLLRRSGVAAKCVVVALALASAWTAVSGPMATAGPALFLAWLVTIDVLAVATARRDRKQRILVWSSAAGLTALGAAFSFIPASERFGPDIQNVEDVLRQGLSVSLLFGIVFLVARRSRSVSLLMERLDVMLLALAVAYALLITGPQWYLGVHVSIISLLGFAVTVILLTVGRRRAFLSQMKSTVAGTSTVDLFSTQRDLIAADRRLTELEKDLKSLEGKPLEEAQRPLRTQLTKEADDLRQWPTGNEFTPVKRSLIARLLTGSGKPTISAGVPLPERARPLDLALALGPRCEPGGNMRKAAVLGAVAAGTFAAVFTLLTPAVQDPTAYFFLDPALPILTELADEVAFWLLPLLLLGIAWGSLTGRRGSPRALAVWACIAVPLAVHTLLNAELGQSSALTIVLRVGLLLMLTIGVALAMDVKVLATSTAYEPVPVVLRRYLGINRVLPTLLLLVPLITAGVSVWTQIHNGALKQSVPVTQTAPGASTSPPTPSPTGPNSPAATPHR